MAKSRNYEDADSDLSIDNSEIDRVIDKETKEPNNQARRRSTLHVSLVNKKEQPVDQEINNAIITATDAEAEKNKDEIIDTFIPHSDIFSFTFLCPVTSAGFIYAKFIFTLQLAILFLATFDLLKDAPPGNRFKIPVWIESEAIAAQFCAILVSILVNRDLSDSFDFFHVIYYKADELKGQNFDAARWKWVLSHICRFSVGLLTLLATFLVIISSDDVLQIFLDFTALTFAGELNVISFVLAEKGVLPFQLQRAALDIKSVQLERKGNTKRIRACVFLFTMLSMYGLWAWIRILQIRGYFYSLQCTDFQINFEDNSFDFFNFVCKDENGRCPEGWVSRNDPIRYHSFSDLYIAARKSNGSLILEGDRPVFYQRDRHNFGTDPKDPSPSGKISYCKSERAWVFSIEGVKKTAEKHSEHDCHWLMKSRVTDEYILNNVEEEDWETWTGILTEAVVDISCIQCRGASKNFVIVDCTYHGFCQNERCVCSTNFMGAQCETCTACTNLRFESKIGDGDSFLTSILPGDMLRLDAEDGQPFKTYARPVYYYGSIDATTGTKTVSSDPLILLLFTGGEYCIWEIAVEEIGGVADQGALISYLATFHSTWDFRDDRRPWFKTEITLNPMPRGLSWYNYTSVVTAVEKDEDDEVDINVRCENESESSLCTFLGYLE